MIETLLPYIFSLAVLAILIISLEVQKTKGDKIASKFSFIVHTAMFFIMANIASEILEGKPEYKVLSYIVNTITFLCVDSIIISFSVYLSELVMKVKSKWKKVLNPAVFFTYIRMLLVLILTVSGNLFIIDDNGCYQEMPLSVILYIFSCIIVIFLIMVVLNNRSYFSTRDFVVILLYLMIPIVGIVVEMLTEIYSFTAMSITLSILLIYVMIQSSMIEKSRMRETILEEISSTDLLTSLNNRRACYNRFAMLEPKQSVGVIFCDINGLKYTNDNFGHAEGDKLIVKFANILTDKFDRDDIFRISGDEFVVIIPNITQDAFNGKAQSLASVIKANGYIAAYGSAYGTGCCVEHLMSTAESFMYETKRSQYDSGVAISREGAVSK